MGRRADADLPKVLSVHVVLERHDVALLLRAEGAGYAAAEEEVLLCLLATGEARGDVAVLIDGALLERVPHQALGLGRWEYCLQQHDREERQVDASAGTHSRNL